MTHPAPELLSETPKNKHAKWLRNRAASPYFALARLGLLDAANAIERLESALAAALARAEKAEKDARRYRDAASHAYKLTATLVQMPPALEMHEREFLNRDRVMDAVVGWRMAHDSAISALAQPTKGENE